MRRFVMAALAAAAVLGLTASQARAQRALSYPMAAHVAAQYGVHHPGHNPEVIREMHHRYGPWDSDCYGRGHGSRIIRPYWGHPAVVVPLPARPPMIHPRVYPTYGYPYRPYYDFYYSTPRFSIGIGF